MRNEFEQAINCLPPKLNQMLKNIPTQIKQFATEIRIRANQPLTVISNNSSYFISVTSEAYGIYNKICYVTSINEIESCFRSICEYSIHSFENEIKNGYITISGGHRIGFCGTAVLENNKIQTIKDISSINIRVARQIVGIVKDSFFNSFAEKLSNILIIGSPSSGKTTILKDLILNLANGRYGKYYKVSVIDERSEISATYNGKAQNNLGYSSDIFNGYNKQDGVVYAIRTMSPQLIVCDEIGNDFDIDAIKNCCYCGVFVIATLHCNSIFDLKYKKAYELLQQKCFDYIVELEGNANPGVIKQIVSVEEVLNETSRDYNYNNNFGFNRV